MHRLKLTVFLTLLLASTTALAAPDGRRREPYTGQTTITCQGKTIRIPKIPFNDGFSGPGNPFLVVDESNCKPDSFSINIESTADCDGEGWCVIGQFSSFPSSASPMLAEFLETSLYTEAMMVERIVNNNDGYYIPHNEIGSRLRKLIWWDNQNEANREIKILAVQELNTDTTLQALTASAKAYYEGGQ